jgi:hypothetical protein
MIGPLLPRTIDNAYLGHKAALWLFVVLVLLKLGMSLNCVFNGYSVATEADGLPLHSYPPAAARTIVSLFSVWGLGQLVISLLCILVLARYRSMIPLMFTLLLLEHLGRRLILLLMPIERIGTPPAHVVNLVIGGLMIVGLALSLWTRR